MSAPKHQRAKTDADEVKDFGSRAAKIYEGITGGPRQSVYGTPNNGRYTLALYSFCMGIGIGFGIAIATVLLVLSGHHSP